MKCDELFVFCKETCDTQGLYYSKPEVDATIAELKEDIAGLEHDVKTLLDLNREQANSANRFRDSMERVIRHQKRKRCLAMAKWCRVHARWCRDNVPQKEEFCLRWHRKWLELAKKFGEGDNG